MAGSGLSFIDLSAGKNVVNSGTEFVTDPVSGQPIERPKVTISDDLAPDLITILGNDGNADTITLDDNAVNGVAGIGVHFAGAGAGGGTLDIVVADSVRAEGDTLVISTLGGNDSIDAHDVKTDRAALRIVAGAGNDILKGTRFKRRPRRRHGQRHLHRRSGPRRVHRLQPRARATAWTTTATAASTSPPRTTSTR